MVGRSLTWIRGWRANEEVSFWGGGDVEALPSGSFPILDALTAAYLCQEPVDGDGWLGVLQRHIGRPESTKVWIAMTRYLPFLVQAQRTSASAFIRMLLERYPEICNHQWGVHMVGQIIGWLPSGLLNNIVDSWIDGDWRYGPQVAGEVIAFALCRNVGHKHMLGGINAVVRRFRAQPRNAKMIRVGIAHTLIVALREPALRFRAARLLIRVLRSAAVDDDELNKVVHRIFGREAYLSPDVHTERLLQECVRRPGVLTAGGMGPFTDGLKNLLADSWKPRLILAVGVAYLEQREKEWRRGGQDRGEIDDGLIEVSLTLHGLTETREKGLELFERLMALNPYGMTERLGKLDRQPARAM